MKSVMIIFSFLFLLCILVIHSYADGPILMVQPDPQYEYIFGVVEIGSIGEKYVYIMNTGEGLLLGSVTIEKPEQTSDVQKEGEINKEGREEGEEPDVFFASGDTSFSLAQNQVATVKIQFIPLKEKEYTAKLKIFASENQSAEVNLRGIGKKKPKAFYFFGCGTKNSRGVGYSNTDFLFIFLVIFVLFKRYSKIYTQE